MTAAVALFLTLSILLGCTTPPSNDFSEYHELPSAGWKYGKSELFRPTFRDSIATGRLIMGVTHSAEYPYKSLCMEVTVNNGDEAVRTDTVCMSLADSFGRWTGTGVGPRFQVTDTVDRMFTLHKNHTLKVRHIMKTDTLTGIEQIGMFFISDK